MINRHPDEPVPIATLHVTPARLAELFPMEFQDLDPLAAPEPSTGVRVLLSDGTPVFVIYGTVTETVMLETPAGGDLAEVLAMVLREFPIEAAELRWVRAENDERLLRILRSEPALARR